LSPDTTALRKRINNDWTDRSNGVPLTEEVETDDPAISLGYYTKY
jgi:hypothetical protein